MTAAAQRLIDFSWLGMTFAGALVLIVGALALARSSLWRTAFWLGVTGEACLLVGAILSMIAIWSNARFLAGLNLTLGWVGSVGSVLVAAGIVSEVVALILLARELARRGAVRWMLMTAIALLIILGAGSAFNDYTLLQLFDVSLLMRLLRDLTTRRVYYGVVLLLLACAPLAPMIYAVHSNRNPRDAMPSAR